MIEVELINLFTNISVLSVAGILYFAYVKNLRSQVNLKDEQRKLAEQNAKFWKEKALEAERQTPQYVEKVLADRVRIREEEIFRLENDKETRQTEIAQKNIELTQLKSELMTAHKFSKITIYDAKAKQFREVTDSEFEHETLGSVFVDSATLMICDPWHLAMPRERELEDWPVLPIRVRNRATGEMLYYRTDEDDSRYEATNKDGSRHAFTVRELIENGQFEKLPAPDGLPVDPETYIKGEHSFINGVRACTFINGTSGAGLVIRTRGDGMYDVRAETYGGEIQRIIIDF